MAVDKIFVNKRLELRVNTGLDVDSNPIMRTRSWQGVKPNVTDANLFALAGEIGGLQTHTVIQIRTATFEELESV